MQDLSKYKKIIFEMGIANSVEEMDIIVDTLYQLAYTIVSKFLNERSD